uniref:Olfactory receptor 135 n=1 Tax=Aulacocentrum confusum TaxID=2767324 RepID=A0A7G8Z9F4_9HYME|nr:olfactory receptor 135 [Aulacocentrum confusum]
MDFLDSHYCRITKIFLSFFGQWPYESLRKRLIITIVASTICLTGILPKVIGLVTIWGDLGLMIDCVPILLLDVVDVVKLGNNLINFSQMHKLFDSIQNEWKLDRDAAELEVMKKYAEEGNQFIKYYICE